jgi:hypothetical protein
MNSQTKILIEGLRLHGVAPLSETCDLFQQNIKVSDQTFWQSIKSARTNAAAIGITLSVTDSDPADEHEMLDDEIEDFSERTFSVRIVKLPTTGVLKFFTVDGFEKSLRSEPARFEETTEVLIAELDFECGSAGLRVKPWTGGELAGPLPEITLSPRRLVNDMSGQALVPVLVNVWIVENENQAWLKEKFSGIAARRLSLCIPDALSVDPDGDTIAHVRSGRKISAVVVPLSADWEDEAIFDLLSEVCKWIYLEGRDAETRHALLTAELVRLWPHGATWLAGLRESLEDSLEAARTVYRLHVQAKGVDVFKLMSDLRKGLSDDVRALATNTASLSSGLWRDAAVAFGVVVLKATTTTVGGWPLWMAAVYLIASCFFSCIAATSAVNGVIENEKSFRSRLYGPLLLDKEYEELAGRHYRKAIRDFRCYRFLIVLVYVLAAGGLSVAAYGGVNIKDDLLHLVQTQ